MLFKDINEGDDVYFTTNWNWKSGRDADHFDQQRYVVVEKRPGSHGRQASIVLRHHPDSPGYKQFGDAVVAHASPGEVRGRWADVVEQRKPIAEERARKRAAATARTARVDKARTRLAALLGDQARLYPNAYGELGMTIDVVEQLLTLAEAGRAAQG